MPSILGKQIRTWLLLHIWDFTVHHSKATDWVDAKKRPIMSWQWWPWFLPARLWFLPVYLEFIFSCRRYMDTGIRDVGWLLPFGEWHHREIE